MEYGMMTHTDYRTMDKTLALVLETFPLNSIHNNITTIEIGVNSGRTSRGIRDFFKEKNISHYHIGIDNQRDFKMEAPFPECRFIVGDSLKVHDQLHDECAHFLLIDGNHNYFYTIADFLHYAPKVKRGGYIAFHDCGPHIPKFQDYQGVGPTDDEDMYIQCRKAVRVMGLLDNRLDGYKLIFDEAETGGLPIGGIIVVQKL